MSDQIIIGATKGLKLNVLPFNIDNEAFATLFNFYAWRGRIKKKRGTAFLGQLQKQIQSVATATPPLSWQIGTITTLDGSGNGSANLITLLSLGVNSSKASIGYRLNSSSSSPFSLSDGTNTFTEPTIPNGTLVGTPAGTGTINYATGALTITGGAAGGTLIGKYSYFPGLVVLGLEDFSSTVATMNFPILIAFDEDFSYQVNQSTVNVFFYNVNYYKVTNTPFSWSGTDYMQFWSTNYSGAFWATNGKPGLNFKLLTNVAGVSVTQLSATTVSININTNGLVLNDVIWINEVTGTIGTGSGSTANQNINGQTGYVTVTGANTITVTFDGTHGSTLANFQVGATGANGIAQYLTATISAQDGIKWYDGDPTGGTGLPTTTSFGWVNFAPPLTAAQVSIDNTPQGTYYLVGALAIVPFKDRLLFVGPIIQTSTGSPITLQDTILWSWNGTPFYAGLVPVNQTSNVIAYYVDQTGAGGYLPAGIPNPITTVSNNEDVLLIGFGGDGRKTRFVYTGNDLQPFLFYNINSELPSTATFSAITLDSGAIDLGNYGIAMTDQQSSQRIDLDIPDNVFQISSLNHGTQRINAARDFFREWIYFSYPPNNTGQPTIVFPTQTFLYNYREASWAIFYESYTKHGFYRPQVKRTWRTTGFPSWIAWTEPWISGSSAAFFTNVVAGNAEGYVVIKDRGTSECISGTIANVTATAGGITQITSVNHCVQQNDYLLITGCLGLTGINNIIGQVQIVIDASNFTIDIPFPTGTYEGLGKFSRLCQPLLQTKQFPFYWKEGRQTRLGVQRYLLDATASGQVTLNIYLSQDPEDAWNNPTVNVPPNSLEYSQILYTCPEGTNLGLTPANVNLQMPIASATTTQKQIWHRVNTSLQGDTVQIGITLSDAQMRNINLVNSEITLHGMQLTVDKGPLLS